jgi:hypothetical protein
MKWFYLSKNNETCGPFTEDKLEAMRVSGELATYNWIWNEAQNQWDTIAAPVPPALPPPGATTQKRAEPTIRQASRPAPAPAQQQSSRLELAQRQSPRPVEESVAPASRHFQVPNETSSLLQALCYDQVNVLSGSIFQAGDNGCDFLSESRSASPLFMKDMPVRLNLLDQRTGTTMSVHAQVVQMNRQDGQWSYRLAWDACPELLLQKAA